MTHKRFLVVLMAVLTALILCACGDTVEVSSAPDGIDTFGYVDPSAQPSVAQTVPENNDLPAQPSQIAPAASSGPVIEGDTPTSIQPSASVESDTPASAAPSSGNSAAASPTATWTPSSSSDRPVSSDAPAVSDEPVSSPAIAPPEQASTASYADAASYVGQSLSALIADLGYPSSSVYEDVDEEDPDTDRIGTLYYDGFTVTTRRTAEGETITGVTAN